MMTPNDERKDEQIKIGMVQVSDGKSRPRPARLVLSLDTLIVQREVPVHIQPARDKTVPHARERMVQITRQKIGGLGLSIKGGAEHKLPILISKIYKDQAADQTGQLFVGDAVIKVNGEYITACSHDDAVSILRGAGDLVLLTVRHYRAATPFLQRDTRIRDAPTERDGTSDTDSSAGDDHPSHHNRAPSATDEQLTNCDEHTNGGWQSASPWVEEDASGAGSRPPSALSDRPADRPADRPTEHTEWVDVVSVPLTMAYVTRYVFGTDKLRPGSFEVRSARLDLTTGVVVVDQPAALSAWLKALAARVSALDAAAARALTADVPVQHMGWVAEGEVLSAPPVPPVHTYRPKFLVLRGPDVMLFDTPPSSAGELAKCPETLKVYQTMFRIVKESETVDWRQHCFLVQSGAGGGVGGVGGGPRYFSTETRQELLRVEAAWTNNVVNSVIRLGKKTFTVVHAGRAAGLTLDWATGFSLSDHTPGQPPLWTYRFSQLRGSSDDGKSKLKLHFQDAETKLIETKELECQILQSLLFCMHAFLSAKVASVDPAFLASLHHQHHQDQSH